MNNQKGLSLILVVILLAVTAGGYLVYQSQLKPLFISQPSPSSVVAPADYGSDKTANDEQSQTANWKTYNNNQLKIAFKYPEKWSFYASEKEDFINISEWSLYASKNKPFSIVSEREYDKIINSFTVTDIFRTFFIESVLDEYKTKTKTSESLIKEYQAYNLYSTSGWGDRQPYEIDKSKILIDDREAIKYLIKLDEPKEVKFNQIIWIYVPLEDKIFNIRLEGIDEDLLNQILSTFKFLDQNTEIDNWEIYNGGGYSISHPSSWTLDPSLKGLNKVTGKEGFVIISSDYQHNIGGYIEKGLVIRLFVGQKPFLGELGLESEEETTWVGVPATLSAYTYEGNNLVLSANIKGKDYQLVMNSSRDLKTIADRDIFLKVAASLRFSQ